MTPNRISYFLLLACIAVGLSCEKEEPAVSYIRLLSSTVNGSMLADGMENIATDANISLVFSASVDPAKLEQAVSILPVTAVSFSYASQGSRVALQMELEYNTSYTLSISGDAIGINGGRLEAPPSFTFMTQEEEGGSTSACTEGSSACLESLTLEGQGSVPFYASFPLEGSQQPQLTTAVIVVHGANRNAGDYFTYLMSGLIEQGKEEEVLLIAPLFQDEEDAVSGELFWSGNGWREGRLSSGPAGISSFEVVDQLITKLADDSRFPALEKIVLTGHSSGGLYTHLFAPSNQSEDVISNIEFTYIVANSQYFYYPDDRRVSETGNQLYVPTDCNGYTIWPLGYDVRPDYLSNMAKESFDQRFIDRAVIYLLGDGNGPDGALNTNDCSATLLGPSRYERGENMYWYMEEVYGDSHAHQRTIVPGVGHDGAGMYRSATFIGLLGNLIDE